MLVARIMGDVGLPWQCHAQEPLESPEQVGVMPVWSNKQALRCG